MEIDNLLEEQIGQILRTHDVLKLIAGGAPDDEYSFDIPQIADVIRQARTSLELAEKLEDFYIKALLPAKTMAKSGDFLKLAADLFALKKNERTK